MSDLYERLRRFHQNTRQKGDGHGSLPPPSQAASAPTVPESLLKIPGVTRASHLVEMVEQRDREKSAFLSSIGVTERENQRGAIGFRETIYPLRDWSYGSSDISWNELNSITREDSFHRISPEQLLFIDTETTGLAGGTGTVPFLIGAGFFRDDSFVVHQYIMRDYDEEPAMLHELNRLSAPFQAVVTYNGKSFDIPVIHSRMILNRQQSSLSDFAHIDLLHPSRRIWRDQLPDCSLSTVERTIFARQREDDIPGEQIPYVFFDFIRGFRMHRMRSVLNHNVDDIVTLAWIAAKLCRMFRDPFRETSNHYELSALGRCFALIGDTEMACRCYRRVVETCTHHPLKLKTQRYLSLMYKRLSRMEEAAAIWKTIADQTDDPLALIELAKYYEHHERNYLKALQLTERALLCVQKGVRTGDSHSQADPQALRRRHERLLKKAERHSI